MMEQRYQKGTATALLRYGQTLPVLLKDQHFDDVRVYIVTNQRFYDRLSTQMTFEGKAHWYVCGNDPHINQFNELREFIRYMQEETRYEPFLLIGLGNIGIMHLANFFHTLSTMKGSLWLIPSNMRALAQVLSGTAVIEGPLGEPALQVATLPQQVFFDTTLQQSARFTANDLLPLIRLGLTGDHALIQTLYKNYPRQEALLGKGLTPFLEPLIRLSSLDELENFGQPFTQAFYQTANGQYLADEQKQWLGILFHFIWSQVVNDFTFQTANFFTWLKRLGVPLDLPNQFLLSDYGVTLLQNRDWLPALSEIGSNRFQRQQLTETTVFEMIARFQHYLPEGAQHEFQ